MAIASFLALCIMEIIACKKDGQLGFVAGIIGLVLFAVSITGFVFGVKSYKKRGFSNQFPWIGMIGNGVMILVYAGLYLIGAIS